MIVYAVHNEVALFSLNHDVICMDMNVAICRKAEKMLKKEHICRVHVCLFDYWYTDEKMLSILAGTCAKHGVKLVVHCFQKEMFKDVYNRLEYYCLKKTCLVVNEKHLHMKHDGKIVNITASDEEPNKRWILESYNIPNL